MVYVITAKQRMLSAVMNGLVAVAGFLPVATSTRRGKTLTLIVTPVKHHTAF